MQSDISRTLGFFPNASMYLFLTEDQIQTANSAALVNNERSRIYIQQKTIANRIWWKPNGNWTQCNAPTSFLFAFNRPFGAYLRHRAYRLTFSTKPFFFLRNVFTAMGRWYIVCWRSELLCLVRNDFMRECAARARTHSIERALT